MMNYIDLHVHSTASDGTCTPAQVVELAKKAKLAAIALTDHDTVNGVPSALEAGKQAGLTVIPGIELSSIYEETEIHILGLFVNGNDSAFLQALERFCAIRDERNQEMLERFHRAGIHLTSHMLTGSNPNTVITRAHVARALVRNGYAPSMEQAFQKYLTYGGPFCPPKKAPDPRTIVDTLKANGAFISLAHPFQYHLGDQRLTQLIVSMKSWGMEGIEVYHSSHHASETETLLELSKKLDLLPTGGSDFHGSNKTAIAIGIGRGNLRIPLFLLENIEKAVKNSPCFGRNPDCASESPLL